MGVYFIIYVIVSAFAEDDNAFTNTAYPAFVTCNTVFVVVALYLYTYSICLVKRAINESSNYNFAYNKSYVMISLYILLILLEGVYLLTFQLDDGNSIVVITMLRITAFFLI